MSKLWPFASKEKALLNDLEIQIKQLEEKLEDNGDINDELNMYTKSYSSSESSNVLGSFGVVDEFIDKAMLQRLYCTETWFFIAVHTIAKTIAALPIKLEKKKTIRQNISQQDGTTDAISRITWIEANGEPEYKILSHPNTISTPVEFWMLIVIDLLATGDAYIYVDKGEIEEDELIDNSSTANRLRQALNKNKKTNVRGIYRISSALVQPIASEDMRGVLAGYSINTQEGTFSFEKEEMIHIRLPNPVDPFYGLAPIMSVMKNLLLDRYTAEHMLRFYKQGARLGGVIKTQKKLTKDQLIRLERIFESNFTGKRNHHKTLVLPEGMEYSTIEQNPGETSLIEFMRGNKEPILAAYNMPPIKVGLLDGATFSNANIQDKTYYNDTIKPILVFIEQAINTHGSILSVNRELKMTFDLSDVEALKENITEQTTAATGMLNSGLSVNEVREKMWKLPPVEGGDIVPAITKNQAPASPAPFGMLSAEPGQTKTEVLNIQNDTENLADVKPTGGTFADRVAALVSTAIAAGIDPSLAVTEAIEKAKLEGFNPIEEVTEQEKKSETELRVGAITKEQKIEQLEKTTGSGIAPLIEENKTKFDAMFSRMEKLFLKKLKSKYKSYQTKADSGLISIGDIEGFSGDEVEWYIESMMKAMRNGYKASISSRPMTFPNDKAAKVLEQIGSDRITGITETTRNQINSLIADSFKEQASVGEIASRIRDVFSNISKGRANTIARTETLTAVSVGQRQKVEEFRTQFPVEAAKMKKVWLTAEDDRVRDTHRALDGVALELDEKFDNGLMFPRDPSGDAGEVINCRCSIIEYLPEDESSIMGTLSNTSPIAQAVDQVDE